MPFTLHEVDMLLTGELTFDSAPFDTISYDLCTARKEVVIMSSDLSKYCQVVRVKNELPEQHLDVGINDQDIRRFCHARRFAIQFEIGPQKIVSARAA